MNRNVAVQQLQLQPSGSGQVTAMGFCNGLMILGKSDGYIQVYDEATIITAIQLPAAIDDLQIRNKILVVSCLDVYYWNQYEEIISDTDNDSHITIDVSSIEHLTGIRSGSVSINSTETTIAAAYDSLILIYDIDNQRCTNLLEGHDRGVLNIKFFEDDDGSCKIISTSEDRTFKIWDISNGILFFQSSIHSSPIHFAAPVGSERILVGEESGCLKVYTGDGSKLIYNLDINNVFKKHVDGIQEKEQINSPKIKIISSLPPWKQSTQPELEESHITEEYSHCVQLIEVVGSSVLVVTSHTSFLFDCDSYSVEFILPIVGATLITKQCSRYPNLLLYNSLLNEITVYSLKPITISDDLTMSVFCKNSLPEVFCTPLHMSEVSKPSTDKAVVFHKNIKSSGYAASVPWSVLRQQKARRASSKKTSAGTSMPKYQIDCQPPSVIQDHHNKILREKPAHQSAIVDVVYSADAKFVLTASSDKTAALIKLPVSKHKGDSIILRGHKAALTSCCTTHAHGEQQLLSTSSLDGLVHLWKMSSVDKPIYSIVKKFEIKKSFFYNIDNVVVVAGGSFIDFHKVTIDTSVNDLERMSNRSADVQIHSIKTTNQNITTVAAHNTFMSSMLWWGGSNKEMCFYDISASKVIFSNIPHSRAVSAISLPSATAFVDHVQSSMEIFATTAPDGLVKLWDVRTPQKPIRSFSNHINRVHSIACSISPCLRYLSMGSEDRCTYLYDTSSSRLISKIHTHTDVVSKTAFSPVNPQMLSVGFDGGVKFMADK